jgi:mannose-6-phosphate isomerase-like protein (cupin superfamily)
MTILLHSAIETFRLAGRIHQTLASLDSGTYTLEVWRESLAAGAETLWYRYDCEAVFVICRGHGECRTRGHVRSFEPHSTMVLESDAVHQLANTGDESLEFLVVLGMTPVAARDAEGNPVRLPWNAPTRRHGG